MFFCIYITTTDSVMNRIRCVVTNFEDEPENVRMSFNLFLRNVVALLSDRREQEELSIIEWCRFMLSVTQWNIFYFFYKILSSTVLFGIFAKLNGWNFSLKFLLKKIFFNILKTIFLKCSENNCQYDSKTIFKLCEKKTAKKKKKEKFYKQIQTISFC